MYDDRKQIRIGVPVEVGGWLLTIKEYKVTFGSDTKLCILIIVVTQVCIFVKTQNHTVLK